MVDVDEEKIAFLKEITTYAFLIIWSTKTDFDQNFMK